MLQSSITAWLKKPTSVKKADPPPTSPTQSTPPPAQPPKDTPLADLPPPPSTHVQPISTPNPFSLPPLPANVEMVPLTEDHMPAFKRLNSLTLPISYPPVFYTETMTEPFHGITLIALWHPVPLNGVPNSESEKPHLIGAIRCRILPSSNLYISTLGLLSPYRSHGIATHLLQSIVVKASKVHGVKCVTAHVWEANDDGLEWYKKRGFEVIGKEDGYYRKLKPSGAVLVRKWIGVGDLLSDAGSSGGLPW